MIYLRTGANGTGKTLLTLRDVREKSLKEVRPVYYNGRFELTADFGWEKIDIKDWQSIPDGAIFIVDECHNDFPIRSAKDPVPEYVKALAEHRRRGFDFYMITQHPMNIDPFVRRLIGSPGWHQHLKRVSGAPLVSVLEWPAVNEQPQKNGSGSTAAVQMVPYPKEVYTWYASTSLDTAKVKIPFQVKLLVASVFLIPLLGYYGWTTFQNRQPHKKAVEDTALLSPTAPGANSPASNGGKPVVSTVELLASYAPRIEGLPHTAPRYDDITKPTIAPMPSACVTMGKRCDCYTQQGTKLQTPFDLCRQIVAGGFFQDWGNQSPTGGNGPPVVSSAVSAPVSSPPLQGNPGIAPGVAMAQAREEVHSVGEPAAVEYQRIGRRLVASN